jgi:hypothetical protein
MRWTVRTAERRKEGCFRPPAAIVKLMAKLS